MVRNSTETETYLASVERVNTYSSLPVERPPIVPNNRPPASWPSAGALRFDNVSVTYREGLPPVLSGVSIEVQPGEKIGVVGRTGAGKSSLMLALFRIMEASTGRVELDGIDISTIGLDDLRSRLAIIPQVRSPCAARDTAPRCMHHVHTCPTQDPVLFSGTLRYNLDPTGKHTDGELLESLEAVQMREYVDSQPAKLDMPIAKGGENLSVGQRQLVCMSR